MVPFAGWQMPVQYTGILDEVRAVRNATGLFDVSHMGEIRVGGPDARAFLQRLLTNDVERLAPGQAQYSLMCGYHGGVLDDLIVYRVDNGSRLEYLIVVNASNAATDYEWIVEQSDGFDVSLADESERWALIAVQGPAALDKLQPFVPGLNLAPMPAFTHAVTAFATPARALEVRVARTGYTGEDGFELFVPWDEAPSVWRALAEAGAKPAGLGARDVLRIEASYPLYGHEIDETITPYEAGLGWVVKPAKGDFIGREPMLALKSSGLPRILRGILTEDPRAVAREGAEVLFADGRKGIVRSGTYSPTLERAISIGFVPPAPPEECTVTVRGAQAPARVVPLPFYKRAR
jgi:aminomethyltransferase